MKIAFFVKTKEGYQILAQTYSAEKALEIANNIKADGVMLDIDSLKALLDKLLEHSQKSRDYVSSKTHHGIQRIPLDQISYFQADQKYVTVYHKEGTLLIEDTLKSLESEFHEKFIRVHRNLLVKASAIESLEKDEQGIFWIKLQNIEKRFPVSRRKLSLVRKRIK